MHMTTFATIIRTARRAGPVLVPALLLAACGYSSRLAHSWKDPKVSGAPYKNVLSIVITADEDLRRRAEDAFVRAVTPGTKASASYPFLAYSGVNDRERVVALLRERGFDAVVVSRLKNIDKATNYVPGTAYIVPQSYYGTFWGYYSTTYSLIVTPGYEEEQEVVHVETNMYDLQTEKLVWTGLSDSFSPSSSRAVASDVVRVVTLELDREGLLRLPR
jgi:hypothetical protein